MSIATSIPTVQPIAQPQPRFLVKRQDIPQAGYDATFIDFGVRGTDVAAEVGFEFFDGQDFWNKVQGGGSGHTGTVFGEDVNGGLPLRLIGWGWREVEREEGVVD